jgi:hypothetical protein
LPFKKVEILYQWTLPDFYICGVSFTISDSPLVCEQLWDEIVLFGFLASERSDASETDTSGFDETRVSFNRVKIYTH